MSAETKPAGKLVYVVEDDEEQLMVLRMLLTGAGFDVVTETNADRVLQGVRELRPTVILMDVMLPSRTGLDGFALCSEIRKDPDLNDVKIIIVSAIAHGASDLREKVKNQAGADDFFVKPYEPPALIERVRQLCA